MYKKQKERIINFALETFLREGSFGIKVDDIASNLKISREVICKIFPSEKELLREVIGRFMRIVLET
jgi:AcrR family transcriptional regulator